MYAERSSFPSSSRSGCSASLFYRLDAGHSLGKQDLQAGYDLRCPTASSQAAVGDLIADYSTVSTCVDSSPAIVIIVLASGKDN